MNHKEKLLEVYKKSFDVSDIDNISDKVMVFLKNIIDIIDGDVLSFETQTDE